MKKSPWKLDPLFTPRSIAVIGASPNGGAGSIVLRNMQRLGYTGTVYPINPKYKEIFGYPCYASLRDLPAPADCAAARRRRQGGLGFCQRICRNGRGRPGHAAAHPRFLP